MAIRTQIWKGEREQNEEEREYTIVCCMLTHTSGLSQKVLKVMYPSSSPVTPISFVTNHAAFRCEWEEQEVISRGWREGWGFIIPFIASTPSRHAHKSCVAYAGLRLQQIYKQMYDDLHNSVRLTRRR